MPALTFSHCFHIFLLSVLWVFWVNFTLTLSYPYPVSCFYITSFNYGGKKAPLGFLCLSILSCFKLAIRRDTKNNQIKWNIDAKNHTSTKIQKVEQLKIKTKYANKSNNYWIAKKRKSQHLLKILRKSRSPYRRQIITINLDNNSKPNIHERLGQWAQLTNMENKGRAYHEPFLKQATLTMINNNKKWMNLKKK